MSLPHIRNGYEVADTMFTHRRKVATNPTRVGKRRLIEERYTLADTSPCFRHLVLQESAWRVIQGLSLLVMLSLVLNEPYTLATIHVPRAA